MCRASDQCRRGFTFVELVVVVMILGILAAIAAPRMLCTSDAAIDNGLRQTLSVIRTSIDTFAAQHDGRLPGADGQEATFKAEMATCLRGAEFPTCPVGSAKNNETRMQAGAGSVVSGIAATAATHSWVYLYETGDFFVNCDATSADGSTTYDEF